MSNEDLFLAAARAVIDTGVDPVVDCAIILGTGLGGLIDDLDDRRVIPYDAIPGFPPGEVSGHARQLCFGRLNGRSLLVFQGRSHYYETGNPAAMRVPVGLLTQLGHPPLILTNAAGSTRADIPPGSLVAISDHINFSGRDPLIGEIADTRFVSLTDAYDPALRGLIGTSAREAGITLREGVYMWNSGPSFETPAEIRMARLLGADLVGMSTVPEVILARHCRLRVAGLSVVTNFAAGIDGASPSHAETKAVAFSAATDLRRIVAGLMPKLDRNTP